MSQPEETPEPTPKFDFDAFPENSVFHDRRGGLEQRDFARPPRPNVGVPRVKAERRRRIDPTTFEKQYTDDELEFMNAMQRFKVASGKPFPSHGDVIKVAVSLGYRLGQPEQAADNFSGGPLSLH